MTQMFGEGHDPGGKVRTRLPPGMKGWAFWGLGKGATEHTGQYRHILGRYWGDDFDEHALEPYALWIGMNPSTAGAQVNDPTVSREIAYTRDVLKLRCYLKCNVMDYRATDPKTLLSVESPRSRENIEWITEHAELAEYVIACWGALHPTLQHYAADVMVSLVYRNIPVWCLGRTKDGHPKHPLYLKKDTPLEQYIG